MRQVLLSLTHYIVEKKIIIAVYNRYVDYIQPKRRGALQDSMRKTTNYMNRTSLPARGTELPQVAC
jgi:hypothetical protein